MKRLTTEEFIEKCLLLHSDRYDYSKVKYISNKKEVKIKCNRCNTYFNQTPNVHLSGRKPNCECSTSLNTNRFIKRALLINKNNEYDYSLVDYKDTYTKVTIICNKCKSIFHQIPHNHLRGSGCSTCYGKFKKTTKDFIDDSIKIHGNLYDYSSVSYVNNITKVTILCKQCNSRFKQIPTDHLSGSGCPKCCGGFSVNKPAILYYIKIKKDDLFLYKIGITNRSVSKRFGSEIKYITILMEKKFEDGQLAYDKEFEILNKFKDYKYYGEKVLKSGNTELFTKDILELDLFN